MAWLGHVDDDRLRALYDGAAVVAVPSRYEGFGLPVLEAMTRGVPVVASEAASLPEVAGEAAILVPPLDAGAWAEALSRILTDERLASRLRAAGALRARRSGRPPRAPGSATACFGPPPRGRSPRSRPRHCGPDRSFAGCCRYFLQAPAPGTLEVRGSAGESESWTMSCETTPNGGSAAPDVRNGRGAFEAAWTVRMAPASIRLDIEAAGTVARLAHLTLRLDDGAALDLLPSIEPAAPKRPWTKASRAPSSGCTRSPLRADCSGSRFMAPAAIRGC